ncbi:hypothetical protein ABZ807_05455 [Micromonospora sp. NPDC047548]|uniref:hypothetical protein n=1 Tax=Micromonospora sp. NPDC047548 TaxID=3155624 RepID=UPI0033C4661D
MHNPSPSPFALVYLTAIAAGTATACWVVRRECGRVKSAIKRDTATPLPVDPDAAAALRRINLRLVQGNKS